MGTTQDLGCSSSITTDFYSTLTLHNIVEEEEKTKPHWVYLSWECTRAACNISCWNPSWEIHSKRLEPGTGQTGSKGLSLSAAGIIPPQAGTGRSILAAPVTLPHPQCWAHSWHLSWAGFGSTGREGGGVCAHPGLGVSGPCALQQGRCSTFSSLWYVPGLLHRALCVDNEIFISLHELQKKSWTTTSWSLAKSNLNYVMWMIYKKQQITKAQEKGLLRTCK